jgi:signal peptidase I
MSTDDRPLEAPTVAETAPGDIPAVAPESAAAPGMLLDSSPVRRTPLSIRAFRTGWEWAKSVSLAIILFVLCRTFLVEAFKIPSGSMESTLLVGDFLLVNKLLYGAEVPFLGGHLPAVRAPNAGDVVVFQFPEDPSKNFVKRLVGLPFDTIEMRAGTLVRNGIELSESYAVRSALSQDPIAEEFRWQRSFVAPGVDLRRYHPSRNTWGPLVVPEAHYFMLGDNRDNSLDSRYWGFVPDSLVRGSPIFVYYSYAPDSGSAFDWLTRVRWKRLFERIH